MKIAITGGTGFLGKALSRYLSSKNLHLHILTRSKKSFDDPILNVTYFEGDICNLDTLINFLQGCDACIHLAAQVEQSNWKSYFDTNVKGTENICQVLTNYFPNCRLINISTISAIEKHLMPFFTQTQYAKSKKMADQIISQFTNTGQIQSITLYPGLIYGPGDTKFLPTLIKFLKRRINFFITGSNKNFPVIFINDLCNFIYKVLINKNVSGHFIAAYPEVGMKNFIIELAKQCKIPPPKYTLPKSVLYGLAIFIELFFKILPFHFKPPLTRRHVHGLSLNFPVNLSTNYDVFCWKPETGYKEGISAFLATTQKS